MTDDAAFAARQAELEAAAQILINSIGSLETAFDSVQRRESATPPGSQLTFMSVIASTRSDAEAIAACLAYAEADDWLDELLVRLCEHLSVDDARIVGDMLLGPRTAVPASPLPGDLIDVCKSRICEITGAGVAGTGFLVASDLVLTAFHVIAPQAPGGVGTHGALIRCRFHQTDREPSPTGSNFADLAVPVAHDWLVAGRPGQPAGGLIPGLRRLANLSGFDDFALIRLAIAPGWTRGWFRLAPPPAVKENLHIWHRFQGQQVSYGVGEVSALHLPKAIRRVHLRLSQGQTGHGSSGSPYANERGEVVAIHVSGAQVAGHLHRVNRATPTEAMRQDVAVAAVNMTRPFLWWVRADGVVEPALGDPVSANTLHLPLVGRRRFQAAVEASRTRQAGAPGLFFVDGPPQSGRTRTRFIVRTLCHEQEHLVANFDVSALARPSVGRSKGPTQRPLAEAVYDAVRRATTDWVTAKPTITPPAGSDFESARDFALTWLGEIRKLRKARGVWVCIDGLGQHPLPTEIDRFSLEALAAYAERSDWFRLVLLGPTTLSTGLSGYEEMIQPPNDDEIGYYLAARTRAAGFAPQKMAQIAMFVAALRKASVEPPWPELVVAAVDELILRRRHARDNVPLDTPWANA